MPRDNTLILHTCTRALIRHAAQRLTCSQLFVEMELEDLEQELLLHVIPALDKFDLTKGAMDSLIRGVLTRASAQLIRKRSTRKRTCRGLRSLDHSRQPGVSEPNAPSSDMDLVDITLDVAKVVESLPPGLRYLAQRLAKQNIAEVARGLGIARSTLLRRIERLRQRFEDLGLQVYL